MKKCVHNSGKIRLKKNRCFSKKEFIFVIDEFIRILQIFTISYPLFIIIPPPPPPLLPIPVYGTIAVELEGGGNDIVFDANN